MSDEDILAYSLWGDPGKGETPYTTLSNKMVTTRKPHICVICRGDVRPGTRARVTREQSEGTFVTVYSCAACCEAMAASWTDHGKAIQARYEGRP
jgi:RNase P subunit RPR2